MLRKLVQSFRGRTADTPRLRWLKKGGSLATAWPARLPPAPHKATIERLAASANQLGAQALAAEYGQEGATRTPDEVRSSSGAGDLYAWLAQHRQAAVIVEFGAAFGVSGMYFASGLEAAGRGHLYSFEINPAWAAVAERNIRQVSSRVTLTRGAFEDHVDVVPARIDIAFVDGIHTYEFVTRQHALLAPRMAAGGLMLFDDIDFRPESSGMADAWRDIWQRDDVIGAIEMGHRLGVIELR